LEYFKNTKWKGRKANQGYIKQGTTEGKKGGRGIIIWEGGVLREG